MPVSADVADPLDAARELLTTLEKIGPVESPSFLNRHGRAIPW
jgi:hypothetical protein